MSENVTSSAVNRRNSNSSETSRYSHEDTDTERKAKKVFRKKRKKRFFNRKSKITKKTQNYESSDTESIVDLSKKTQNNESSGTESIPLSSDLKESTVKSLPTGKEDVHWETVDSEEPSTVSEENHTDVLLLKRIPLTAILSYIVFGYIIGVVVTIFWHNCYDKEVYRVKWLISMATVGLLLCLCYSSTNRCTFILTLPVLFSSRGRSFLMAMAFLLITISPTVNFLRNIHVMTNSLSCGQFKLKRSVADFFDLMKKPIVAIKKSISDALNELKKVAANVKAITLQIRNLVVIILNSIKNVFNWLGSIIRVCNNRFDTPFNRCMKMAEKAMTECRKKMTSSAEGICDLTNVFKKLCYTAKIVDLMCVMISFIDDSIISKILAKLKEFEAETERMFYVSIRFDHDYYLESLDPKSVEKIKDNIVHRLYSGIEILLLIFTVINFLGSTIVLLIVFKAIYFRMKYTRHLYFQNHYITKDFVVIDEMRKQHGMDTLLPLTYAETLLYPRMTDLHLTPGEVLTITRSIVFLTVGSIQIFGLCLIDYGLFLFLSMIANNMQKKEKHIHPIITMNVEGTSITSDILRGIAVAFEPFTLNRTIAMEECIPHAYPPNYKMYCIIGFLCILSWIFSICEPYGLRLRHVIMRYYYPNIAKRRAVWLYRKILLERVTFYKLARRKIRLVFKNTERKKHFTIVLWVKTKLQRFFICTKLIGSSKDSLCILCTILLKKDIKIMCPTPDCQVFYCKQCYAAIGNICCLCHEPIDYGDLSDISMARDSSDDSYLLANYGYRRCKSDL